MSESIIDMRELDFYSRELMELANRELPKQTKKFLRKEGTKLRAATVKKARAKTNKQTGNYYKGIKAGKVYQYRANENSIRVYGGNPAYHAHLLEYGHRQVQKGRVVNINGRFVTLKKYKTGEREVGFVPGLHIFEEARNQFADTFYKDIQDFLDEAVKEL